MAQFFHATRSATRCASAKRPVAVGGANLTYEYLATCSVNRGSSRDTAEILRIQSSLHFVVFFSLPILILLPLLSFI